MGMSAVVDEADQPRAIVAVPLVPSAADLLVGPQLRGSLALITEPPTRVIARVSEIYEESDFIKSGINFAPILEFRVILEVLNLSSVFSGDKGTVAGVRAEHSGGALEPGRIDKLSRVRTVHLKCK